MFRRIVKCYVVRKCVSVMSVRLGQMLVILRVFIELTNVIVVHECKVRC